MKQFIGIAHVTDPRLINELARISYQMRSPLNLCISVVASYRALKGKETRWGKMLLPQEKIRSIMRRDDVLYILDYRDCDNYATGKDYIALLNKCGDRVYGIQFNRTSWPSIDDLSVMRDYFATRGLQIPKMIIPVNIGGMLSDKCEAVKKFYTPQSIALIMKEYRDHHCADYVLLHKDIDAPCNETLLTYIRAIRERTPEMGIVLGGGLWKENTPLLEPIIRECPDISITAQKNLRFSGCAYEPIDNKFAKAYLRKAIRLFSRC